MRVGIGPRHAAADRPLSVRAGRRRKGRRPSGATVTDPFYLQGLVRCCGMPMWSVTRHNSRRYRCATCGHGIDALTAEVEVWERACERNLSIGDGRTPYEKRRDQLTHHLDH